MADGPRLGFDVRPGNTRSCRSIVPAQIKAFYGFPALVPFSALVAVGWNWLGQKHRAMRIVLWVVLLVWTMTVYATFWVRSSNPETHRVRGIYQAMQHSYAEAIASLSQTLRLNPDDADAHCHYGGDT